MRTKRTTPLQLTRDQLAIVQGYARRLPADVCADCFLAAVARGLRSRATRDVSDEDFRAIVVDAFLKLAPHIVLEIA